MATYGKKLNHTEASHLFVVALLNNHLKIADCVCNDGFTHVLRDIRIVTGNAGFRVVKYLVKNKYHKINEHAILGDIMFYNLSRQKSAKYIINSGCIVNDLILEFVRKRELYKIGLFLASCGYYKGERYGKLYRLVVLLKILR